MTIRLREYAVVVGLGLMLGWIGGAHGQPFPEILETGDLDGVNGFTVPGVGSGGGSGETGSGTDVNGDGVSDLLMGADSSSPANDFGGEAYVIYGRRSSFPAVVSLYPLDAEVALTVRGYEDVLFPDDTGESVAGVGDANGDGFGDFLVGVPLSDRPDMKGFRDYGQAYLVYGRDGFEASLRLEDFVGSDGVIFNGAAHEHRAGVRVAGLGDVNGDGLADFGVGALLGVFNTGGVYVVFGSDSFPEAVELSSIGGSDGLFFQSLEIGAVAYLVASAGDINGDDFDDVVIGAPAPQSTACHSLGRLTSSSDGRSTRHSRSCRAT